MSSQVLDEVLACDRILKCATDPELKEMVQKRRKALDRMDVIGESPVEHLYEGTMSEIVEVLAHYGTIATPSTLYNRFKRAKVPFIKLGTYLISRVDVSTVGQTFKTTYQYHLYSN